MQCTEFAAVGDNCIDWFVPPLDECFIGGNAVNVAVQLALLGHGVGYFGAVGDDRAGLAVRESLAGRNIDTTGLLMLDGLRTAYTAVEVSGGGDRIFTFEEFGACAAYRPLPADLQRLKALKHVHVGWLNDGGALKRDLMGSGATISQDLGVNNASVHLSPDGLDVAFMSSEPQSAEAVARHLVEAGAKLAVVTMGAAGSVVATGDCFLRAPALPISPVDTTGAGDAYYAGFLSAFVMSADLQVCMDRGMEQAAKACMHRGGFPQQPVKGLLIKVPHGAIISRNCE